MQRVLTSEQEMIDFGAEIADLLLAKQQTILELVGDVGSGKTTLTKGLAKALGVAEEVTSPSFTISKQYQTKNGVLVHYDFYRLEEPGIMQEDLAENLAAPDSLVVIEWGESVADLLPAAHAKILVTLNDDGSRTVETEGL